MIVFVDTFALIAWLNPRDQAHKSVVAFLDQFTGRLLTTEWVLMELADALSAPIAREAVVKFIRHLRSDPPVEIADYRLEIYDAGFRLFSSRADKSWSLTDCISFSVMSQRSISDALTADHHFTQAGFHAIFGAME